ncbi:hypothetical protein H4219_001273 [Mycoemilia scoparia]|uniref:Uncharacterized protein n=1 Tax=Mycoemilia scoparia TaxID=417184 RepID=A0A9W8A9T5_9FUNG|nr:hypothetical protein H4219_001273 [Mycoemilia scoparia]
MLYLLPILWIDRITGTPSELERGELAMMLLGGKDSRAILQASDWLGEAKQYPWGEQVPYARVAEFLQEVMPLRMQQLWNDQMPQTVLQTFSDIVPLPRDYTFTGLQPRVVIPLVPAQQSQSPSRYGSSLEQGQS